MNHYVRVFTALVVANALAIFGPDAAAQAYPSKPIRVIVPFVAGGGADISARLILGKMQERMGQSLVVDNKPGGNTIIGVQELTKAAPDGYTLLWSIDQTFVLNPALYTRLPYDPQKDFTPIALAVGGPISVITRAGPGSPQTMKELVDRAKANPGKLNIGSAAILAHVALAEFNEAAGVDMARINYKGSAEVAQGTMAGDVDAAFDGVAPYLQFVKAGRAKILAVTSARRLASQPDVPTLDELGYKGMDLSVWFGLVGPAGMPPGIVKVLSDEMALALRQPDVVERLATFAFEPMPSNTPTALSERITRDLGRYTPVVKKLGLKLD